MKEGFTHQRAYHATDTLDAEKWLGKVVVVLADVDGGYFDHGHGTGTYGSMEIAVRAAARLNEEAGVSPAEAQAIVIRSMFPNSVVTPADFEGGRQW